MSWRSIVGVSLCVLGALAADPTISEAAPKKKAKKKAPPLTVVSPDIDGYYVEIKKKQIFCLRETQPGTTKLLGDGRTSFESLTSQIAKAKKKKQAAKASSLQKLLKQAKRSCVVRPVNSIDKYRGQFGYAEAARLARVAGFGAPPALVNELVGLGMERAVDRLVDTNVPEPVLEAQMRDLTCDTYFEGEQENEQCDPSNENDFEFEGMRTAYLHYFRNTANQFQAKLLLFLHDHIAASTRVLNSCERYAALDYMTMLRQLAANGDLSAFWYNLVSSHFYHIRWLSGSVNRSFSPNEDFGREWLELATIGKNDLDGNPRYGDNEIIASARAMTGYTITSTNIPIGNNQTRQYCAAAFVPNFHDQGAKVLWQGTPFEAVVYDAGDMVEASKRHPGAAEYWALNLWKEYVNDAPSKRAIQEAAEFLRSNNYNIRELLRRYLKSTAFYVSPRTLDKRGIEYMMDILRTTGMPPPHPRSMNYWAANELGQSFLNPPTVFGWHTYADNYMGGRFVIDRRNVAMELLDWSEDDFTNENIDPFALFLGDAPSAPALVDRWSMAFGIELNPTQRDALIRYMDYSIDWQNRVVRDAYDSVRGSDNAVYKLMGLLIILAELDQFQVK